MLRLYRFDIDTGYRIVFLPPSSVSIFYGQFFFLKVHFITALHGMQTCDENSVRPSVKRVHCDQWRMEQMEQLTAPPPDRPGPCAIHANPMRYSGDEGGAECQSALWNQYLSPRANGSLLCWPVATFRRVIIFRQSTLYRVRPTVLSLRVTHLGHLCSGCSLQKIFDILLKTKLYVLLYYCDGVNKLLCRLLTKTYCIWKLLGVLTFTSLQLTSFRIRIKIGYCEVINWIFLRCNVIWQSFKI